MARNKWDPKDPADVANYWYDWADFLPAGVSILTELVEQSINPLYVEVPMEIDVVETDFIADSVRAKFSGGTAGVSYPMDCTITTSDGQTFQQTVWLQVKERIIK